MSLQNQSKRVSQKGTQFFYIDCNFLLLLQKKVTKEKEAGKDNLCLWLLCASAQVRTFSGLPTRLQRSKLLITNKKERPSKLAYETASILFSNESCQRVRYCLSRIFMNRFRSLCRRTTSAYTYCQYIVTPSLFQKGRGRGMG